MVLFLVETLTLTLNALKVKSDLLSPTYHQYGAMSQFSESFLQKKTLPKVKIIWRTPLLLIFLILRQLLSHKLCLLQLQQENRGWHQLLFLLLLTILSDYLTIRESSDGPSSYSSYYWQSFSDTLTIRESSDGPDLQMTIGHDSMTKTENLTSWTSVDGPNSYS